MTVNIRWNRKQEQEMTPFDPEKSIGQQIMDSVHSMMEEKSRGETKEEYAARVYAKVRSGKKLTPDEMNFLARTNPIMYQKVLRAQMMRNALENRLKSCRSKQEAEEIFSAAVSGISENDPDREMITAALTQAYKEFRETDRYQRLPETNEEAKERKEKPYIMIQQNANGYQETYLAEEMQTVFSANG